MRFFLIDTGLNGLSGHHYNYAMNALSAVQKLGYDPVLISGIGLESFALDIEHVNLFSYTPHTQAIPKRGERTLWDYELSRILPSSFTDEDIIYLHLNTVANLVGTMRWIQHIYQHVAPRFIVRFWTDSYMNGTSPEEDQAHKAVMDEALEIAQNIPNRRILVMSMNMDDRKEVKDRLASVFCACEQYFHLVDGKQLKAPIKITTDETLNITFLGHGHVNKGTLMLPQIIRQTLDKHDNVKFTIQLDTTYFGEDFSALCQELDTLRDLERVEIINGTIDYDTYFEFLAQTDIVIIPYAPSRKGHGVFCESAGLRKVIVMPSYHYFFDYYTSIGGAPVPFDYWNADSISAAVSFAIENHDTLQNRAIAAGTIMKNRINADILLKKLISCMDTIDTQPELWRGANIDGLLNWK